jgi:hemerythrin-like metal-binding protein
VAIAWDPALLVGIPEIDQAHQELFRRLDALHEAIRGGRSREEVGRTLTFLHDYALQHFSAEQALMAERAYPGAADHRAEHEAFVGELEALEAEYRRDGPTASLIIRVNTQLTGWLRSHIYRTDRALVAFLRPSA